jgi:hypothetical protein
VTAWSRVCSLAGTFHDLSSALTSPSSDTLPSCASFMTVIANTGLLIDAAWKTVPVSTSRPVSTSATPYPFAQWIL